MSFDGSLVSVTVKPPGRQPQQWPKRVVEESLPTVASIMLAAIQIVEPWNKEVAQEVQAIAKSYVRQLQKLSRARAAGKKHQARNLAYWLTVAQASKICAVILSFEGKRKSLGRIIEEAADINPRKPTNEAVHVSPLEAEGGKVRAINKFGPVATAKQTLVRDVEIARLGHSPYEFSRKGRGRDAVVRRTLKAINQGEVTHLVEADIRGFFPSVDSKTLSKQLGIPASIVRNTVCISLASHIHTPRDTYISERTVRCGLPLGSRLSPLIASKLLEPTIAQVGGSIARSFIDNIGFGAGSLEEATEKKDTLAVLLRQHLSGPFTLKYNDVITIGEMNDVLGYLIRPEHFVAPNRARATPSIPSIHRAQQKLAATLLVTSRRNFDYAIENWSEDWVRRYPVWTGQENGRTSAFLSAFDHVVPFVNRTRRRRFSKAVFRSFKELGRAARTLSFSLRPDPFYRPLGGWNQGILSVPS